MLTDTTLIGSILDKPNFFQKENFNAVELSLIDSTLNFFRTGIADKSLIVDETHLVLANAKT